jgi:hypothetical protein
MDTHQYGHITNTDMLVLVTQANAWSAALTMIDYDSREIEVDGGWAWAQKKIFEGSQDIQDILASYPVI